MIEILVGAAADAFLAASAAGLALFCIWPALRSLRARPSAFILVGVLAAAVPVALALRYIVDIPDIAIAVLAMTLIAGWVSPRELVGITGGARRLAPDVVAVFSRASEAWASVDVGDLEGATDHVNQLDSLRTSTTGRYIDAWQTFIAEEHARRSGERVSSAVSVQMIREEAHRLTTLRDPMSPRRSWATVALATVIGVSPAIANARACIGVELLLASPAQLETAQGAKALPEALIYSSEPGSLTIRDQLVDLQAAAESRHDPDTYAQLVDAGFIVGHMRAWMALDGRQLSADVFEFREAAGALSYQRAVNRHACQFSNEAFGGPSGGVGLQVRYSNPEYPIVEQYSWVSGTRRFVVSVDALEAPADHERVLRLATQVMEHAEEGLLPARRTLHSGQTYTDGALLAL